MVATGFSLLLCHRLNRGPVADIPHPPIRPTWSDQLAELLADANNPVGVELARRPTLAGPSPLDSQRH
jgi:hypothetical protein